MRKIARFKASMLILIIFIFNCNLATASPKSPKSQRKFLLTEKKGTLPQTQSLPTFKVRRVEISGSTVLDRAEIKAISDPLIGKEVTLEQILQLRTAITDRYVEGGYTTSGAFFPLQEGFDGIVRIQIIEGELENIEINGLKRLSENYVESRLKLSAGKPLNIRNLEKAIQLLQQNPLFNSVETKLISGSAPGLSILRVDLSEAPSVTTQLSVANDESPNIGEYKATVAIASGNLMGLGDRLSTEYSLTEGLDRYSLSYSIPIDARDGNLFVSYKNNDSEITRAPFVPIDLKAESRSFSFGYRQPIIKTPEHELALSLALDLRENESFLARESFSLERDRLGETGKSKISALRFTQEWLSRSPKNILATSSQFSMGIDAFDATVRDTGTDGRFVSWLGQFQWLSALNNKRDALLVTSLATQITLESLLSIEQFAIGGFGSVRGYEQNQRIGDNGIFGSVELRVPLIRDTDGIGLIQLAPFFDVGTVWSDREENDENNVLASLGLGINWELGEILKAQVYYGIPLIDVEEQSDSLQSDGINFSIQLTPLKF
jgi:hemolysin activation/secretion protein